MIVVTAEALLDQWRFVESHKGMVRHCDDISRAPRALAQNSTVVSSERPRMSGLIGPATRKTGMSYHLGTGLAVAGILILVGLSAFFSSSETAIFSLPPDWLTETAAGGDRREGILQELRSDPHRLLVTILVGNNVVNVAISSLTTVLLIRALPANQAVPVATVVVSVVVLIFGEIVPKAYGLGHAKRWSLAVAGPLRIVERALSPIVHVFDVTTRWLTAVIGGDPDIEEPLVD